MGIGTNMLPFTKVEGLGNDFVVVDLRPGRAGVDAAAVVAAQSPGIVTQICDRHFGVGADGVLAILPVSPTVPGGMADVRMRVLNADGSEAEMCGNGIRCVAKVLYEGDPALRRSPLRIDTAAGLLECALEVSGSEVTRVAVEMGRPRLSRDEIPLSPGGHATVLRAPITAGDRRFEVTAVSMGNPHAIIFVDDPRASLRTLAEVYGPVLELDPLFPRRTNVEFARTRDGQIDLVVWERGCGITLACGTGACATAVAAGLEGRIDWGTEIVVNLPGGPLLITVAKDGSGVRMRGPATTVFRSEIDLAKLRR
jgi:diaminopimelate epimerase